MIKHLVSATLFLALAACSSSTKKSAANGDIDLDSSLLLSWEEANEEMQKLPALYEFHRGEKKLLYLASKHSNDRKSSTFKLVDAVFEKNTPELLIIEGFPKDLGLSPQAVIGSLKKSPDGKFYPDGEPSYVIQKAQEKKIPFTGAEPSDKAIFTALQNKGYTAQDLLGFNFVRRMKQIQASGELKRKTVDKIFNEYVKAKIQDFGMDEDVKFTFAEFKDWYKRTQNKKFSITSVVPGETAPMAGPFFTQKLALDISKMRDEHILATIGEMMNKHKTVFIIYGGSHYHLQQHALEAALGGAKEL